MEKYDNLAIRLRYRDRMKFLRPMENIKLSFYIIGDKYFPNVIRKHFTKVIDLPKNKKELSTIVENSQLKQINPD